MFWGQLVRGGGRLRGATESLMTEKRKTELSIVSISSNHYIYIYMIDRCVYTDIHICCAFIDIYMYINIHVFFTYMYMYIYLCIYVCIYICYICCVLTNIC